MVHKSDDSENPQGDSLPEKPRQAPVWRLAFGLRFSLDFG